MSEADDYQRTIALLKRQTDLKTQLEQIDAQLFELSGSSEFGGGYDRAMDENFKRVMAELEQRLALRALERAGYL